MSYFSAEMQKDWRAAMPGLMFGRHSLHNYIEHDRYGATNTGRNYFSIVEGVINGTLGAIAHGLPLIRCNFAGGGADTVTYNTYVAGGAGSGTSTAGCFLNFCGVSALQTKDNYAGCTAPIRNLIIMFPDISTVPVLGSVMTQAVTGATGIVIGTSAQYNWVIVRDLGTGLPWNTANVVTNGGGAMVPAAPIPNALVWGSQVEGNADSFQAGAGIWAVIRGYAIAFCQGDVAGAGYNGAIADCTPLTWNSLIIALVAANYHSLADHTTIDVWVNPDNVIAHSMGVAGANTPHFPELVLVYMRADEPLVYAEVGCQGQYPRQ